MAQAFSALSTLCSGMRWDDAAAGQPGGALEDRSTARRSSRFGALKSALGGGELTSEAVPHMAHLHTPCTFH